MADTNAVDVPVVYLEERRIQLVNIGSNQSPSLLPSAFHPFGVDKRVVAAIRWLLLLDTAVTPSGERLRGEGRCGVFAGKTVIHT